MRANPGPNPSLIGFDISEVPQLLLAAFPAWS